MDALEVRDDANNFAGVRFNDLDLGVVRNIQTPRRRIEAHVVPILFPARRRAEIVLGKQVIATP